MIKAELFYLTSEKRLYAYTANPVYAELFKKQRDMTLFKHVKRKVDKYDWMVFTNKNNVLQLIPLPLFDGKQDMEIIGTAEEDSILSESSERLDSDFEFYRRYFSDYPLNEKYLKLIEDITDIVKEQENEDGTKDFILRVDTFGLFYYLFKKTFIKIEEDEEL